jgi:macrodomain Ter protein organizer (MatP/YcbG family)
MGVSPPIFLKRGVHTLMKKYSGKKKSCHYKLSEWHREKLAKLAKATRRTMTSVIEELIEKSE